MRDDIQWKQIEAIPYRTVFRLQLVLNSAAHAVTNTPKFHHITPILKSLHWLKISEHIHSKILSITYKCLLSDKPAYLRKLLTVQSTSTTRSASVNTLKCPYNPFCLKVSSWSLYPSAPVLWNTLPKEFRQYNYIHSTSFAFPAFTFLISQETQNSSFRSFLSYT
jgi:hypothetical protein